MKNVVLHIGTGKTGTSTIQNALYQSAGELKKSGVDYASVMRIRLDHFGEEIVAHYKFAEALIEKNTEALEKVRSYIADSPAHTVIFSCENFYHHLGESELQTLLELLADFKVLVICYIRRQDLYVESAYKQQVKVGAAKVSFKKFIFRHVRPKYLDQVHANYFHMLKRWSDVFGRESIIIRRFDKTCFINGDLLDDFMASIGLDTIKLEVARTGNANLAFPSQLIQLVRAFNAAGVVPRENQQAFVGHLRSQYEFDNQPLVTWKTREKIAINYGDANEQLNEYFELKDNWDISDLLAGPVETEGGDESRNDFDLLADVVYTNWSRSTRQKPKWHLRKKIYYLGLDSLRLLSILLGFYQADSVLKKSDYLSFLARLIFRSEFSPTFYARVNRDVASTAMDPFVHYIYFGCQEGRVPHPSVSAYDAGIIARNIANGTYLHRVDRERLIGLLSKSEAVQ